jgi:hypothetical protein
VTVQNIPCGNGLFCSNAARNIAMTFASRPLYPVTTMPKRVAAA